MGGKMITSIIWIVVGLGLIIYGFVSQDNFLIIRGTQNMVSGGISFGWLVVIVGVFGLFRR